MENLTNTMKEIKTTIKNWWVLLIIGIAFVAMGFLVFNHPVESYITLSIFFASLILVSGIFQVIFSIANQDKVNGWGWQLALGLIETFIGIILFSNIGMTMAVLPLFVGFWLMFRSFALVGFSFELKDYHIINWWLYLILGILLAIFSWMVILNPGFGGITIIIWTGIAFVFAGVAHIMLAFRLRKVNKKVINFHE